MAMYPQASWIGVDPDTAEVRWIYALTLDPYGIYPDLPEEHQQVGREYFARVPGSKVKVSFRDLPDATRLQPVPPRCGPTQGDT
jgi:hypothetical protein